MSLRTDNPIATWDCRRSTGEKAGLDGTSSDLRPRTTCHDVSAGHPPQSDVRSASNEDLIKGRWPTSKMSRRGPGAGSHLARWLNMTGAELAFKNS